MDTHAIFIWFKSNRKKILVHSCILGSFLLYSLFLATPLFDRFEAIPGEAKMVRQQLPGETNNVYYSLERFITSASALEIQGWAFMDGYDAENSRTFIVLRSYRTTYIFETSAVFAAYVTAQYQESNLNLDWSGFITTIPTRKIERGNYAIGLYITKNGTQALQYTDKAMVKSKDDVKLAVLASNAPEPVVDDTPVSNEP